MRSYGIEMEGKIIIQKVTTLPAWGATDEGRLVYAEDVDKFYVGNNSAWAEIGAGDMSDLVDDITPQLGGNLDYNSKDIVDTNGNELLSFSPSANAVNEITFTNAGTGYGPEIQATGDDTNIDIELIPKGTGSVNLADAYLKRALFKDYGEFVTALGDLAGGTDNIDYTLGPVFTATISTGEQTFAFTNPPTTGGSFTLKLTNGGSQTIVWPSVIWAGGVPPADLTTSGLDVLVFETDDGGTTWSGYVAGLDVKLT